MERFGGQLPAVVPVHGADTEPSIGRAEPRSYCLNIWIFLLFASKQSLDCACFSTESGEQFSTTQICTGGCTAAQSRL